MSDWLTILHLFPISLYLSCTVSSHTCREVHAAFVIAPLKRVKGTGHLTAEVLASVHTLALQVVSQVRDVILVPVQDGRLADAEGAAGVVALPARIPQTLPRLATHQHGGDVVDLIGCFGAGALLRLRDPAAFTPASASVQNQYQAQDGQQQSDHASLQRQTEEQNARRENGERYDL